MRSDDPDIQPWLFRPELWARIAQQTGLPLEGAAIRAGQEVLLASRVLESLGHGLLIGKSGSGKTSASILLIERLLTQGCSLVLFDPKTELFTHSLQLARRLAIAPQNVFLFDPTGASGNSGWNPFAGAEPLEAAKRLVDLLQAASVGWGARLADILTHGFVLLAVHRLSVLELELLLTDEAYREGLLSQPADPPDRFVFQMAARFFAGEFASWSNSQRSEAVSAALRKARVLIQQPALRSLLVARRSTLQLEDLWREQTLVLVRLDASLGDEARRVVAGLLVHQLLRTALRVGTSGKRPVVLAVDELAQVERLVGELLGDVAAMARFAGVRLLLATQYLAQLSPNLATGLLTNAGYSLCFQSDADAAFVASRFAVGVPEQLVRATLSSERTPGEAGPRRANVALAVRDAEGGPLRIAHSSWARLIAQGPLGSAPTAEQIWRLARKSGICRLYVCAPGTGRPVELFNYLAALAPTDYHFAGAGSLRLIVQVPTVKLSGLERWGESAAKAAWTRTLLNLPRQHAAVRIGGETPVVVRVADVALPKEEPLADAAYRRACEAATGQSAAEVAAVLAWREQEIERIAGRADTRRAPVRGSAAPPLAADTDQLGHDREQDDASLD